MRSLLLVLLMVLPQAGQSDSPAEWTAKRFNLLLERRLARLSATPSPEAADRLELSELLLDLEGRQRGMLDIRFQNLSYAYDVFESIEERWLPWARELSSRWDLRADLAAH